MHLFEKYVSLLPTTDKYKELYLHPKCKPAPKTWYDDRCLGINSIRSIVKQLCSMAGFTDGNYRNHSLRATACSRLYAQNQDEQSIKEISGHHSNCVHTYKHTDDSLKYQASAILQSNEPPSTVVKPNQEIKGESKVELSDTDDFKPDPFKV